MAQQTINLGTVGNDGTGEPLRNGGVKINANFTELYSNLGKGYIGDSSLVNTLEGGITTFKGNFWRRTAASTTLTTSDGSLMPIGLMAMATKDNPSTTNIADWIFWNSF